MTRFILTPSAGQDLEDIWNYLARDSVGLANRVLKALEQAIRKLAKHQGLGHFREDLADRRHKFFLVYSDLIVYRPGTNPLQVIRVVHAARDIQSLLGFRPEDDQSD